MLTLLLQLSLLITLSLLRCLSTRTEMAGGPPTPSRASAHLRFQAGFDFRQVRPHPARLYMAPWDRLTHQQHNSKLASKALVDVLTGTVVSHDPP